MTTDLLIEESLTECCKRLEHFETPEWAVKAILRRETMTKNVIDPCCGSGVLARAAQKAGYNTLAADIRDWGFAETAICDWLMPSPGIVLAVKDATVLMNPPFSMAVGFVEQAIALGARKIICFQRFAWWESQGRRDFWEKHPPNRVYICGDRANCWRHDIPEDQRGSSSPTAHAFFVWEKRHPPGTLLGHIWKSDAEAA